MMTGSVSERTDVSDDEEQDNNDGEDLDDRPMGDVRLLHNSLAGTHALAGADERSADVDAIAGGAA